MKRDRVRASLPVEGKRRSSSAVLVGAVVFALLVTTAEFVSEGQAVRAKTASETVWRVVEAVPAGTSIPAKAVVGLKAPAAVAHYLYTGRNPAGRTAKVMLLPGDVLARADLGGSALRVPPGYVGVWVATNPTQDGSLAVGEWVVPYLVVANGGSAQQKASAISPTALQIVAMVDANGNSSASSAASSGLLSISSGGGGPSAVELAAPAAIAGSIVAASANHAMVLAVPGGAQ